MLAQLVISMSSTHTCFAIEKQICIHNSIYKKNAFSISTSIAFNLCIFVADRIDLPIISTLFGQSIKFDTFGSNYAFPLHAR